MKRTAYTPESFRREARPGSWQTGCASILSKGVREAKGKGKGRGKGRGMTGEGCQGLPPTRHMQTLSANRANILPPPLRSKILEMARS